MNEILKQRLVGALILVALGVVFWPIIFVEPGEQAGIEQRRIPTRPDVDTQPIPAPDRETLRASPELESRNQAAREEAAREAAASAAATQASAVASKPPPAVTASVEEQAKPKPVPKPEPKPEPESRIRTEAPEKPALDAEGVPIAWILQVASVSKPEKAEQLRTRLLAMGHEAYVKKIRRSDNVLLRVYIGPKFERAPLEKIKSSVDAEFGVQSLVVRYLP